MAGDGARPSAKAVFQPAIHRSKPIEQVKAGEKVWACDPATGQWSAGTVLGPLVHEYEGRVVTLKVGQERIEATANHPFWVVEGRELGRRPVAADVPAEQQAGLGQASGRWVEAGDLQPGDLLLVRSGALPSVEEMWSRQAKLKVYNLEVAGLHTYAVSDLGVLVHNKPMQIADVPMRGGSAAENATVVRPSYASGGAQVAERGYVNLASGDRTIHILYGDRTGGGHLWPGMGGTPPKTPFPGSWSAPRIMHEVSDIVTDPAVTWRNVTGPQGSFFTRAGNPARWEGIAVRDGVTIRVIYEPAGEGIITAHPMGR